MTHSTQIVTGSAQHVLVSKKPASIFKNAGLIPVIHHLKRLKFFDELEEALSPSFASLRPIKGQRENKP